MFRSGESSSMQSRMEEYLSQMSQMSGQYSAYQVSYSYQCCGSWSGAGSGSERIWTLLPDPDPHLDPNNWLGSRSGAKRIRMQILCFIIWVFVLWKFNSFCKYKNTDFKITSEENFISQKLHFYTVKALILRKLHTLRSDPDPNIFGSCSAPEADPNPNGYENQDPDPNKVGLDPPHWLLHIDTGLSFKMNVILKERGLSKGILETETVGTGTVTLPKIFWICWTWLIYTGYGTGTVPYRY